MLSALLCLVVTVSDGQTLQVQCPTEQRLAQSMTVQVHGIATPHLRQSFGPQAKQALARLCYLQQARVSLQVNHQSTEPSARVLCRDLDVAAQLVTQGLAWAHPQTARQRADLQRLERDARTQRRGLWSDLAPVAPWIWQADR